MYKMALPGQNSIANELLQTISDAKFTQVLCLLNPEFVLTVNHFKRIKDIAHNNYWIDTQRCITKSGKSIASGIFDIFGRFESCLACKSRDKADELALYCLSKVYNRHVKVYTSSYCWTTL